MLKLPVPALVGGKPTNIQLKPSEIQKQMVTELGERADKIRNKMVKPYEDNMLKITNDGRKLALDQRLIDPDLPDDPDSKVNICVGKIFEIWEHTMPQRSAQLVFCDLSTPKAGVFNVYDDMKAKFCRGRCVRPQRHDHPQRNLRSRSYRLGQQRMQLLAEQSCPLCQHHQRQLYEHGCRLLVLLHRRGAVYLLDCYLQLKLLLVFIHKL